MTDPFLAPDPRLEGDPRTLERPGLPGHLVAQAPLPTDAMWMARALERAREAAVVGEVPVGAVVVAVEPSEADPSRGDSAHAVTRRGRLIAEGRNRTRQDSDPTAHAEIVALRAAGRRLGRSRLPGTTLYVTLEPCAQCAGAAVLARVDRVVYGAADPKAGMAGSLGNLLQDPRLNHRVHVTPGVLAHEAGTLLTDFFRARRL